MTPYGKRLKEARLGNEWSIETLAIRSGVSRSAIWDYEKGRRAPGLPIALDLARALKKPVSWFVQDYGKEATK